MRFTIPPPNEAVDYWLDEQSRQWVCIKPSYFSGQLDDVLVYEGKNWVYAVHPTPILARRIMQLKALVKPNE